MSKAVFLSYASQDAEAALRLCSALRAAGVEVWFDQNELVGGDAWDAKIRKQIKECALFVPLISANTNARAEGYFRREWRWAMDRMHDLADDHPFLVPVIIDDSPEAAARVPERFRERQWIRIGSADSLAGFCDRIGKLLAGETGAERVALDAIAQEVGRKTSRAPSATPERRWLVPVIAAVAVLITFLAWPRAKDATAKLPAPSSEMSPAAALVAKARVIFDEGDELNRETYSLAEELLKKAEALDVTQASAWALHARLSYALLLYGLERGPARFEAARTQAERALKLAPDSFEAQLAAAVKEGTLINGNGSARDLEALAARQPGEVLPVRHLLFEYVRAGRVDEALAMARRGLQLASDDPRLKNDLVNGLIQAGRWAEAAATLPRLLEGRKSARLLASDVYLKLHWSGDLAGAMAAIQQWPSWFLLEDRGVSHAALAGLWSRNPARVLQILAPVRRAYLRDYLYTGPKAVLSAWAHEQAGNAESARAEWTATLQAADRELSVTPDDPQALFWKSWALVRLGDTTTAAGIFRRLEEGGLKFGGIQQVAGGLGGLALVLGEKDKAIQHLANTVTVPTLSIRANPKAVLRLNPVFDTLRGDPRFQALVDAAPGPESGPENAASSTFTKAPVETSSKSVAVLAFANLSDEKDNEYFSDGISEELLNVLAKIPGLKVSARTSAFYFKGKPTQIADIAKQLGVAYVVEGSVRKAGNRVRITAQLIKASDGFHVWSDNFNRELKDIFAVQDEIAGHIAQVLAVKLRGSDSPAPTQNLEAYSLYLKARAAIAQRGADNLRLGRRHLEAALALDPDFVPARAALARALSLMPFFSGLDADQRREIALAAEREARRAIATQPGNAEAWSALGEINTTYFWRWREAAEATGRATALAPNDSEVANFAGDFFQVVGERTQMVMWEGRAVELDPLHAVNHSDLAFTMARLGDYEGSLRHARDARALDPTMALLYRAEVFAYGSLRRFAEMRAVLQTARKHVVGPEAYHLGLAIFAAHFEARHDEGLRLLAQLAPLEGDFSPAGLGHFYLLFGKSDEATRWLQRAYEVRDYGLVFNSEDLFPRIAADPKARVLLQKPELRELMEIRTRHAASAGTKR